MPGRSSTTASGTGLTSEGRAFVAVDQGAATSSATLIGRIAGQWRLLGALALPAGVPVDAIADQLVARLRTADPDLAAEIGVGGGVTGAGGVAGTGGGRADGIPRLVARPTPPEGLA